MKQDPDVPVGNRHHVPAPCDAAGSGIDQKVIEGVRGHGSIIRRQLWALLRRWDWALALGFCLAYINRCSVVAPVRSTAHRRRQNHCRRAHHRAADARLARLRVAHRRRRQSQRHGRRLLPQDRASRPWKAGPPLLRIGNERINENALQYMTPNGFAGSIFDLEPGTELRGPVRPVRSRWRQRHGRAHRHRAHARRADARARAARSTTSIRPATRASRQEPAFTGLLAAYYTGSSHSDNFNTYPPRVQPGDTILVHAGVYKDDRYRYGGGLGTVSSGTYFLTQSGTAEKPIVIKAAGDGEAIFDGDGAYNLFNVMAANYNYFEGLTIRNTELAFQGGLKNIAGSSGLTIKRSRFENVGRAIYTDWSGSKDYYIADNVMIGRFNPNYLMGFTGRTWTNLPEFNPKLISEYAVKVYGSGHVVAYNSIANFHDGVDVATYGNPDGSPEADPRSPAGVDRLLRQRHHERRRQLHRGRRRRAQHPHLPQPLLQPRPPRAQRAADVRRAGVLHPQRRLPRAGRRRGEVHRLLVGHRRATTTRFIAPVKPMLLAASNVHYRNNLILGKERDARDVRRRDQHQLLELGLQRLPAERRRRVLLRVEHAAAVDARELSGRAGQAVGAGADASSRRRRASGGGSRRLKEYRAATGQDAHSVLVDYDVFVKVTPPGPDPRTLYKPADFDFRLREGSAAVDAGVRLTGINDDFTGKAPDLGAYEVGKAGAALRAAVVVLVRRADGLPFQGRPV